jgi:RND family efflux transporter MFP subunit
LPEESQPPLESGAAESPAEGQPEPETPVAELPGEAQSPPEPRPTGQELPEGEAGRQEAAAELLRPPSSTGPEPAEREIGSSQEAAAAAPLQPEPSSIDQGDAGRQEAAAAPSRPSPPTGTDSASRDVAAGGQDNAAAAPSSPSRPTGQELPGGEAGRQEADAAPSQPPARTNQELPEGKPGRQEASATPSQPSASTGPEPAEREIGRGLEAAAAAPLPPPRSTGQELREGAAGRQEPAAAPFLERLLAAGGAWRRRREAAAASSGRPPPIGADSAWRDVAAGGQDMPAAAPSLPSRPTGQELPEGEAAGQEADAAPSQPLSGDQELPAKTAGAGLPTKAQPLPETSEADKLIARSRAPPPRRPLVLRMLITCVAVVLAVGLGWAAWDAYMGAPWTRDGTVRVYVVTMAPEVAGRVVDLPVADNQFVHRGDLLMGIDPTDYKIAVNLTEAALQQARANVRNSLIQAERRRKLTPMAAAEEEKENFATSAEVAQAQYRQAMANLDQARVNLKRTEIRSPVNGWVTNLLAQRGDYATVGVNKISLVDADSFWVDAYFEETSLGSIREGDQASVRLMGYNQILRGHVASIARAINVANAEPNGQGVANVNPIFTWVRLSQRIPVRIHIDNVPDGVRLAAGLTATVQVDSPRSSNRFGGWMQIVRFHFQ